MTSRLVGLLIFCAPLLGGCTLVGGGIGSTIPRHERAPSEEDRKRERDSELPGDADRPQLQPVRGPYHMQHETGSYWWAGALVGAVVDVAIVIAASSAMSDSYARPGDTKSSDDGHVAAPPSWP